MLSESAVVAPSGACKTNTLGVIKGRGRYKIPVPTIPYIVSGDEDNGEQKRTDVASTGQFSVLVSSGWFQTFLFARFYFIPACLTTLDRPIGDGDVC